MSTKTKKIRRAILWALGGFVVLLGAALLALQTSAAKAYVLEELTTRINQGLAGQLEAERVSGTLLFGATLHDVELLDARGNEVLVVDEAELDYSIFTLFGETFDIGGVGLERPELTVRRYDDGALNVSLIAAAPSEPAEVKAKTKIYDIPRFRISEGTVHYEEMTVADIDATGELRLSSDGDLEGIIEDFVGTSDAGFLDQPARIEAEEITVEGNPAEMLVVANNVGVGDGLRADKLRVSYARTEAEAPVVLDGRINSLVVTPEFAKRLAPSVELTSPVTVGADFDGQLDNLDVTAVATSGENARVEIAGTVDTVTTSFDLAVETEDFVLSNWIAHEDGSVRLSATGTVAGKRTESGAIQATTNMNLKDAVFGEHRAEEVILGDKKPFVLRFEGGELAAQGNVEVRGYKGESIAVRELATTLDIKRVGEAVTGTVRADLDSFTTGDRTFDSATVTLDLSQEQAFSLGINAVPNVTPRIPLTLRTAGVHGESFDLFELASLEVGSPGLMWTMRDEASLKLAEETIVIDSLVLEGPTKPIRLDGTYPIEDMWATVLERLGRAGLDELLRGGDVAKRIREQLPQNLGDLTPSEIEDAVPDQVEDRVRDKVRRRIRLPEF